MARGKNRRVPEVLWRLFRNSARTMVDTIIVLISSRPAAANCNCEEQRCLSCIVGGGGDAISFLLRPDDPREYRKLLTQCFLVVSRDAPPLLHPFSSRPVRSQHQIVTRTIELIMCEQSASFNVICSGYNKYNQSGPVVDLLTSSAWDLLLERVGAGVMVYLLKYNSIFLPLTRKRHHQVAGPCITDLCSNILPLKRKNGSATEELPLKSSYAVNDLCDLLTCIGCNSRSHLLNVTSPCRKNHSHTSLLEAAIHETGNSTSSTEGIINLKLQQSSGQTAGNLGKRFRPFSWQRYRKRRQLNLHEAKVQNHDIWSIKDSLSGRFQCYSNARSNHDHEKVFHQASRQCCCFLLQTPRKIVSRDQINRQPIFYNSECFLSYFPTKHILYSLKPNTTGANILLRDIFGLADVITQATPCFHSKSNCGVRSSCLYHLFLKLFKVLIRKARYSGHSNLLDKHCIGPTLDQNIDENGDSMPMGREISRVWEANPRIQKSQATNNSKGCEMDAINYHFEFSTSYCSHRQVVSFLWAVCRSVVPDALLGSPSNQRNLRKNISKFVQLRRFEKFSLKQCMHKVKASEFPLLSNKHSSYYARKHFKNFSVEHPDEHNSCEELNHTANVLKQELLESWIFWLFSGLVVPLVKANFFVTESEYGQKIVYYYRKSVWEKLTNQAITSMEGLSYTLLDDASVTNIISNRSFGFSQLRLRPKGNFVRALANLKAPSRLPPQMFSLKDQCGGTKKQSLACRKEVKPCYLKSVNFVLRDMHAVLKGISMREPDKLGSSVFDYNDAYRKLCPFVNGLKKSAKFPDVFIVVSDVLRAFDSVDQDMLLRIMKDVIREDGYLLKQSQQVICTKKSLSVCESMILNDQNPSSYEKTNSAASHASHCILVNQGRSKFAKAEELYFNLKEHVKRNVLRLGEKFYLQNIGIPQGSVLSSLMCSLYYGHLEKNVIFPFLERTSEQTSESSVGQDNNLDSSTVCSSIATSNYLLLRLIDDFIFISTSKKQATSFFSRLQRGFREYNCYLNEKKFSLNFYTKHLPCFSSSRVYVGEDGISFLRWSGLLINCRTLEVQADYARFLDNHMSSTLTVHWQGKPLHHLKARLCDFVRPKCHPIFFDSNINSSAVVRLNTYQAFLLSAMKFHCYVCELSANCRFHAGAYRDMIARSLRYMHKLIKRRMFTLGRGSSFRPVLRLQKGEVEWLGLNAFISVLKRKQSRHVELLSLLRDKLAVHDKAWSVSPPLLYAVDESHSSLLWRIKY